jgi:hypothetical protein
MRKLINSFIKKLKKEDYDLDSRIPTSYLLGLMLGTT